MNILGAVSPVVWITLAGGLFTLGYLIINQVLLRVMITLGSLAYIAYYFTVADQPLWGAIFTSVLMMTANLIGLAALLLRNAAWTVPARYKEIYPLLQPILPGDFRALMRQASRYVVKEDVTVTVQGEHPSKIYFVIDGKFKAHKFDVSFPMNDKSFVGEVAYLLNRPSAATTIFSAGTEVLEWDRAVLAKASSRNPRFKLALESVMSRDLAEKVALAISPVALETQGAGKPKEHSA